MQQMQRDQSDMDMNGNRPQSPASTDNAPSPSKRPRLENGQQLAPNGRGQGQNMQGQPTPLMMQNGVHRGMNPAQFQQFQQGQAAQQKSMQVYSQNLAFHHSRSASNSQGIPNGGMMNPGVIPNQTDVVPMPDGSAMYPAGPEFYGSNGPMGQVRPGMQTPGGGQHGNHALQDYQMQLMLLEQQNKRRLMMARAEQDSMARADGQPPMPGQGALPPGTSPQGSRTGASPNPSEQMKRGTPKMPQSGLPGSPSAADMGQNRGSPGSMNLNGQLPPEMAASFFPGGPNMRPPSSNPAFSGPQMSQPIPANAANRMPSGQWQPGQPIPPQHSPAIQPQAGTPQERGAMPPPQAPPAANAGRGQPPSPQTAGNAPPTPQQTNKPAPKGKKDTKDTRKRPNKKNAAAANNTASSAPSTEAAEPAPTPTPSTPVTPQHPNSFNKGGANATASAPAQPTSAPAHPMVPPAADPNQQNFGDLSLADGSGGGGAGGGVMPDGSMNDVSDLIVSETNISLEMLTTTDQPSAFIDFSALDGPDLLETFDFDTFLNTDGDGTGFGFDPNIGYSTDGVETGATDGL